jgi:predicted permease
VIGVAEPTFRGGVVGLATDLFVPITMQGLLVGRNALNERADRWVHAFMRPIAGGRPAAARAAARAGRSIAAEFPIETIPERAVVVPIWQWPYGAQSYMLPAVGLLGVMSVLLLVVVSANVAGLVLVRSVARRGETAMRLTLGATRHRILRQLLIEGLVLAAPAAVIGFVLPAFLESFLGAAAAKVSLPLFFNTAPDRLAVGVTTALAVLSALIHSAGPAVALSRVELSAVLKDHRVTGGRAGRLRSSLVVVQIAVAVVLLVVTALVLRTLGAAQQADAGFDPRQVTWASFDARSGGYDENRGRVMYARLLDAVRAEPGVSEASLAAYLPLTLIDWMSWEARPDGYQPKRAEPTAFAVNIVTPGYFRTLQIPLVAGREFEPSDDTADELHLIVNATFARRFWGTSAAAIGRRVVTGGRRGTIVGVARDIKYARLDEAPRPYLYVPFSQFYSASMTLQVRGGGDAATVLAHVRAHARAIDPAMAVLQSGEMADTRRSATSLYETLARMLTLVGVLAVGVAAIGVYGLIAYTVKQKQQEIGVRTALGAPRGRIVGQFLRHGVRLAIAGIGIGVIGALGVGRLMTSVLLGVAATDFVSFTFGVAVVMVAALLASLAPAWRAATANPVSALRQPG